MHYHLSFSLCDGTYTNPEVYHTLDNCNGTYHIRTVNVAVMIILGLFSPRILQFNTIIRHNVVPVKAWESL